MMYIYIYTGYDIGLYIYIYKYIHSWAVNQAQRSNGARESRSLSQNVFHYVFPFRVSKTTASSDESNKIPGMFETVLFRGRCQG